MPELPEVETVVRQLRKKILGRRIVEIKILDKKVIDKKVMRFLHLPINSIDRRGKAIIISSQENHLLAHLRMTGHFYHVNNKEDKNYQKYLAGIFRLDDGSFLTFNEIRRFGSVRFMTKQQLERFLLSLGQEPLQINQEEFVETLKKYPSATIKNKLLDQKIIAGMGNIYAQEALYHAGIDPRRKIKDVSTRRLATLHIGMQRILRLAIEKNGTTVSNYSHLDGKGNFQDFLAVYKKEFCPKKHPLQRLVIGGRGTYYCKQCQK